MNELVESGPPNASSRAALAVGEPAGPGHPVQMLPQPGCSFSNCENEEPTYCTVKLAKKSRPLCSGCVKPTNAAACPLGAVGRRLPSCSPPTNSSTPGAGISVTEEVNLASM